MATLGPEGVEFFIMFLYGYQQACIIFMAVSGVCCSEVLTVHSVVLHFP